MTVIFARSRIAKIRNDMCYSNKNLINENKNSNDNKEKEINTSEALNWFEVR